MLIPYMVLTMAFSPIQGVLETAGDETVTVAEAIAYTTMAEQHCPGAKTNGERMDLLVDRSGLTESDQLAVLGLGLKVAGGITNGLKIMGAERWCAVIHTLTVRDGPLQNLLIWSD